MASLFDKYYAAWQNEIPKKMYDNISKRSPGLRMAMKNETKWNQGGDTIQPAIEYAFATNAGFYKGYDTLDITPQQTLTDAQFPRAQAYASIVYNGYEVASSRGKNAIFDMAEVAMKGAETAIFDKMASAFYQDGTVQAKSIIGLNAAIDDGTTTAIYGGIDRTSNAFWRSYKQAAVGSLGMEDLTLAWASASRGGPTNSPDYGVAGLTAWLAVNTLCRNRFQQHVMADTDATKLIGKLGFPTVYFMGIPIVYDEYCPTDTLYLINSETVQLWSDPVINFKPSELTKPANMDAKIGQVLWTGQLICTEPRANAKLTGITGADTTTP